ncbi:MAG: hypothetical protein ACOC0E_01215 [Spirochaetota bacterium]
MMRRLVATVIALGLAVLTAGALLGCHALTNPVDPRSRSFTGETVGEDQEEAPRVLPEIVRWEIVFEHGPGRFLGLEITPDGSFVEPRDTYIYSETRGVPFALVMTFAEPVFWRDLEGGVYLFGYRNEWEISVREIGDRCQVRPETSQVVCTFEAHSDEMLQRARARAVIVDRNGRTAGAISFSFLQGDVTGDGVINTSEEQAAMSSVTAMPPNRERPATIRADLNTNGLVEGGTPASPTDTFLIGGFSPSNLEGLDFPDF